MSCFHTTSFAVPCLRFGDCHFSCPWANAAGYVDVVGEVIDHGDHYIHGLH